MRKFIQLIVLSLTLAACSCSPPSLVPDTSSKFDSSAAEALYESSMRIRVWCPEGQYVGSGVAISKNQVVTAKHVMECRDKSIPSKVEGRFYDGRKIHLIHQWSHKERDVSILVATHWKKKDKLVESEDPFEFAYHAQASLRKLKLDETVCFMGGGGNYRLVIRKCGTVSNLSKDEGEKGEIQISMLVVGGNSGGPVFDKDGYLVGIMVKRDLTDAAGYAEPIELIADVMGFKKPHTLESSSAE